MSASWLEPTDTRAAAPRGSAGASSVRPSPRPPAPPRTRAGEAVPWRPGAGRVPVRRSARRHHAPSPTTCCSRLWLHPPEAGCLAAAHPRPHREDPPGHPGAAASRRRLQRLSRGPRRAQRHREAYAALKLAGLPPTASPCTRARSAILRLGGIQEANSYVRINLSLFGLYPAVGTCRPFPAELAAAARRPRSTRCRRGPRAIVMPLSIVQARTGATSRPRPGFDLDELAAPGKSFQLRRKRDRLSAAVPPARHRASRSGKSARRR